MAVKASPEGFRTLLKKRNFLYIWLAQLLSMTVQNASNYAVLILIEELTGSTTLVGLAIIAFSVPALLLGGPAGVYVDRMNKRRVLWVSNILRAAATLAFVVSLLLQERQLLVIYLLTFIISSIGQFFSPAEGSSIPLLVSDEELMPALSLFNITFMLSQAFGFIILAPIVLSLLPTFTLFGVTIKSVVTLYFIIALIYVVCAVLVALIPAAPFKRQRAPHAKVTRDLEVVGNMWREMFQGWNFVRRNRRLFLAVIQLSFAGILILVIGELATPIVTKLLQLPATAMAFVFAPAGIGLVLGSIFMPRITQRIGKARAILIGAIGLACLTAAIPLTTLVTKTLRPQDWNSSPLLLIIIGAFMFGAGIALDFINIPAQTAMQEHSPDWCKGRVLALQLMLYSACSIPVILLIGVVADLFGVDHVLYVMAVCELAFGLWGLYYEHRHRHAPEMQKTAKEEEPEPELDTVAP